MRLPHLMLVLLMGTAAVSSASAQQLVSDTCRMGKCDKEYLLSAKDNPDGTISVHTRMEFYTSPDATQPVDPPGPPKSFKYTISCAAPGGFIRFLNSYEHQKETIPQPNPQSSQATYEPDMLWAKVCGRPMPE